MVLNNVKLYLKMKRPLKGNGYENYRYNSG